MRRYSFQVRAHLNNLSHVLIGVDIETSREMMKYAYRETNSGRPAQADEEEQRD